MVAHLNYTDTLKTKKYEKYDTKKAENDSGTPWRMKHESN